MKEMCEEYGIVHKEQEPYEVLFTKWVDYEDVLKLKTVENMVEVYYNSGQFKKTLEYAERFFEDAFSIYERLGQFYVEKGYGDVSHSRMRRYEILLEFLETIPGISREEAADRMVHGSLSAGESEEQTWICQRPESLMRSLYGISERQENVAKNAHVEVFGDGKAVLFDYNHRDPLTNNAYVEDVTEQVFEKAQSLV